MKYADITVTIV